jgi:hypothetical protein
MAKAVYWKSLGKYQSQVLRTGQLSQADPSMVKVQVRSHYQCGGGGMWPGIPRGQVTGTERDILESI